MDDDYIVEEKSRLLDYGLPPGQSVPDVLHSIQEISEIRFADESPLSTRSLDSQVVELGNLISDWVLDIVAQIRRALYGHRSYLTPPETSSCKRGALYNHWIRPDVCTPMGYWLGA